MTRFLIWAVPVLLLAAPTAALQASTDDQAASAAPAKAPKEKKICRRVVVTGRRIAHNSCYTAAQWAEYDTTNEKAAKDLVDGVNGVAAKAQFSSGGDGALTTGSLFGLGPSQ